MKNEETCSNTESIIPILKLKYKILSMIADQPIGKQLNKSLVLYWINVLPHKLMCMYMCRHWLNSMLLLIYFNFIFLLLRKHIKQVLIDSKGETDSNRIIAGTFIPHFHQRIDHPERESIGKHRPKMIRRPDRLGTHAQNGPSKSNRIHVLFEWTGSILQGRSHVRPQNKS